MSFTVCFTGRRPKNLCGYNKDGYAGFIDELAKRIEAGGDKIKEPMVFISGGAQGFDQIAFWAVYKVQKKRPDLNIRNIVYVPYRGQEKAWQEEGLFGQKEYRAMLHVANEVVYLKEELTDKNDIINALLERNHAMVNASDSVVALYDGDIGCFQTAKGGTFECVRYAYNKHKIIHRINYSVENGVLKRIDGASFLKGYVPKKQKEDSPEKEIPI